LDRLSSDEAFGRAAEPWEVAATIAFLASDYSSYLTGEVISVSSQRARVTTRRDELLELAATMMAERGLRATTVRDIADAAGILSGSLYHHFSSKEEMVDEVLRGFLDWLFARYQEIIDTEPNPLARLEGLFMASFEAIDTGTRRW
jgi:AcrR family transcriptional regulator